MIRSFSFSSAAHQAAPQRAHKRGSISCLLAGAPLVARGGFGMGKGLTTTLAIVGGIIPRLARAPQLAKMIFTTAAIATAIKVAVFASTNHLTIRHSLLSSAMPIIRLSNASTLPVFARAMINPNASVRKSPDGEINLSVGPFLLQQYKQEK